MKGSLLITTGIAKIFTYLNLIQPVCDNYDATDYIVRHGNPERLMRKELFVDGDADPSRLLFVLGYLFLATVV